jgi:hypothetical protein
MAKPSTYRTTIQSEQILGILRTAAGSWVPLPEIQACAAQYSARIFELRKREFRIENRTELIGDARHSWFRLMPLKAPTQKTETPKPKPWEQIVKEREEKLSHPEPPFELVP